MTKGSNDLNMLIKAKVIKIMAELDIAKSLPKIKRQVTEISKKLENKPVKLKVVLDATMVELNRQMKLLTTKLQTGKSIKPLKIKVQIDVTGSATQIKTQLQQINTTVENFNAKYGAQVKRMEEHSKRMKVATVGAVNIPTKGTGVQNFNNMKQYTDQLKEAERIMRSKVPKGAGLFGTEQIKDANGNLKGFIATLTRANGVVEKARYSFSQSKGAFELIDRKTSTNVEREVKKAVTNLKELERELGKTGKQATQFKNEYNALMKQGAKGDLTGDAVKTFQLKIKNAEAEINKQKVLNDLKRTEIKLLRDIRNVGKGTGGKFVNQTDSLLNSAKTAKDAEAYKAVRSELNKVTEKVKEFKQAQAESSVVASKKTVIMNKLTKLLRETHETEGVLARDNIRATQNLVNRARTTKELTVAQNKLNNMLRHQTGNKDSEAREVALKKLKATMIEMARVTGKSASTIEARFNQLSKNISGNVAQINAQIKTYQKVISKRTDAGAIANLQRIEQSIVPETSGRNGYSNAKMKALITAGDNQAIAKYLSMSQKLNVSTASLRTNAQGITTITANLASAGRNATALTYQIDTLNGRLRNMGSTVSSNVNANRGIFEQLRIAMTRVPVWMGAMTVFYGSIRSIKAMTRELLTIDSAMTELRRVASSGLNLEFMFQGAVGLAKDLGNNVHDVMQSVNDLARTYGEFNERQLLAIATTATLMSNVSELTAQESTESLIGTMNAFNITAEESIRIVDVLNEVDNNYAISTKQLATGLQKSASTARTFGVTLEETAGHITAIGAVTMESGNIIGNSLKTIYSRMTTMNPAIDALLDVGVAVENLDTGEVRKVNDILYDLSLVWHDLSDAERQHTAVQVAGRYQLSRFLALMNNYDIALSSTTAGINSEGSAMRENAQYMKSYEARINGLKTAFTEFSISVGNAVLSSSMDIVIRGLTSLAEGATNVVSSLGFLPIIIGVIGIVMFKMKMFNGTAINMIFHIRLMRLAFLEAKGTALGFTATLAGLKGAMWTLGGVIPGIITKLTLLGVAFLKLMASIGVGLVFVGIGILIEGMIRKFNDAKKAIEDIKLMNDKMVNSYRSHSDGMQGMVDRYDELKNNTMRTAEEQEELNRLTRDFAEQLPTTVDYIDSSGEAHLRNTESIKREIEVIKELSKAQADMTHDKFVQNMDEQAKIYAESTEKIKVLTDKEKDLYKTRDALLKQQKENNGKEKYEVTGRSTNSSSIGNINDLSTRIALNDKAIHKNKYDVMMAEAQKNNSIQGNILAIREQTLAYLEADNKLSGLGDRQTAVVERVTSANDSMLRNTDDSVASFMLLYDAGVAVGNVLSTAFTSMTEGLNGNPEAISKISDSLGMIGESIPDSFFKLDDEFGNVIKSADDLEASMYGIIDVGNMVAEGNENWEGLKQRLMTNGMTAEEATISLYKLAQAHGNTAIKASIMKTALDENNEALIEMEDRMLNVVGAEELLFGYSGSEISQIAETARNIMMLQKIHGDGAKELSSYNGELDQMAYFFRVSTTEIEKNIGMYSKMAEGLKLVDFSKWDMNKQSLETYVKGVKGLDKAIADLIIKGAKDGTFDVITGNIREIQTVSDDSNISLQYFKKGMDDLHEGVDLRPTIDDLKGVQTVVRDSKTLFDELRTASKGYNGDNFFTHTSGDGKNLNKLMDVSETKVKNLKKAMAHGSNVPFMADMDGKFTRYSDQVINLGTTIGKTSEQVKISSKNASDTVIILEGIEASLKKTDDAVDNTSKAIKKTSDVASESGADIEGSFKSMHNSVRSNTSGMITSHDSQVTAIQRLSSSAKNAKLDIEKLNNTKPSNKSAGLNPFQRTLNKNFESHSLLSDSSALYSRSTGSNNESGNVSSPMSAMSAFSMSMDSAFSTLSGSEGGSSSTGEGGSTGFIKSPVYENSFDVKSPFFNSLAKQSSKTETTKVTTKKAEEPSRADQYEYSDLNRRGIILDGNLSKLKALLEGLDKNTKSYRDSLKEILKLEGQRFKIISQQLRSAENNNKQIEISLKKLPAINKHTVEQREQYNKLQAEFDSNLSKIASLKSEVASATVEMRKNIASVFSDLIDEIVSSFDVAVKAITNRIEIIDFKIEVFELTEPDNINKKVELLTEKTMEYVHERQQYEKARLTLEKKLSDASKKYGKDSDVVKKIAEELHALEGLLRTTTLSILKTEKEINDIRVNIANELAEKLEKSADKIIDGVKKHYTTVQKSSTDASDAQINDVKRVHESAMKMYDAEIKRINDIYSAKLKSLDDETDSDNYDEELAEKTKDLSEMNQKMLIIRDDVSPEGKKKTSELNSQIITAQKDLDKFMKTRQKDLLKDKLNMEKDAQVEVIESKKEHEKEMSDAKVEALEKERDAISAHYEAITQDEDKWAKLRGELIKGNFSNIKLELEDMGIVLTQLSDGTFDTMSEGFASYSQEVRNFVHEMNSMITQINTPSSLPTPLPSQGGSMGNGNNKDIIKSTAPYSVPAIITKAKTGVAMDDPTPDKSRIYDIIKGSSLKEITIQEIFNKAKSGETMQTPTPEKTMLYNLFLEVLGKKIASFDTGGYTGEFSGGKLMMAHEKELMLNQGQTKDLLDSLKIVEKLKNIIPLFNMPNMSKIASNISSISNNNGGIVNEYNLTFEIAEVTGDKKGAETMMKEVMNGLKKIGK